MGHKDFPSSDRNGTPETKISSTEILPLKPDFDADANQIIASLKY